MTATLRVDVLDAMEIREGRHPVAGSRLEQLVAELLVLIGEEPQRPGLADTPRRVARALAQLTTGYGANVDEVVNSAVFEEASSGMVLVRDVEFHSLCEHHMLPFAGVAHVAYVPAGRILGLSKVARIVDVYARRLQVQERLTRQVAESVDSVLRPRGVAVVIEATHTCMSMRGVGKQRSTTRTSEYTGLFVDDSEHRREFLSALR